MDRALAGQGTDWHDGCPDHQRRSYPTTLDLAGAPPPKGHLLDGVSMVSCRRSGGKERPDRDAINLAKAEPAKAQELHGKLVAWRKSIEAPMPTPNVPKK